MMNVVDPILYMVTICRNTAGLCGAVVGRGDVVLVYILDNNPQTSQPSFFFLLGNVVRLVSRHECRC